MSDDHLINKPKGIRDIDGEKINDLVDAALATVVTIRATMMKIPKVIDEAMARGIDIGYFPLGTLTIRLGPKEPKE